MTVDIQVLRGGDEAALDRVALDVFDDPIVPAVARAFVADPRHHVAVAIDDGIVVGFVSAVHYLHPDKPSPELWINEVSVAESHREQGLAKRILGAIFETGRALGCSVAWVLTERDNTPAMRLYAAMGGIEAPKDAVMFEFDLGENRPT
ncbi:MAG: GNAT family N-acetyltransferase [Thermoflexales bacterium]